MSSDRDSWLAECGAIGKTMQHADGARGVVREIAPNGWTAILEWEDGTTSEEHIDFLTFA